MTRFLTPFLLLVCVLLGACTAPPPGGPQPPASGEIAALAASLRALGPGVDPEEAERAARVSFLYPLALARSYNITDSPYVHNVKVNNGQRARGLCWHWAEDMEMRLRQESFRTLTVHRAIAQSFPGFEHSTSVISRRGDPMQRGIVVDPWRAGGRLFWSPVLRDDYEWRPRMEVLAEKWLKRQGGAPAP
ncbi:hypothetical protein [Salipiger sp.]|uniref:hypothetical protein n=1 Tax=Salipiger sp. TaxID=2078585 RepID=UPI003A9825B6